MSSLNFSFLHFCHHLVNAVLLQVWIKKQTLLLILKNLCKNYLNNLCKLAVVLQGKFEAPLPQTQGIQVLSSSCWCFGWTDFS